MGLFSRTRSEKTEQQPQTKTSSRQEPVDVIPDERGGVVKKVLRDGTSFITPDIGGKDVYVHKSFLNRQNMTLKEGQRVMARWGRTDKGLEAVALRLA